MIEFDQIYVQGHMGPIHKWHGASKRQCWRKKRNYFAVLASTYLFAHWWIQMTRQHFHIFIIMLINFNAKTNSHSHYLAPPPPLSLD